LSLCIKSAQKSGATCGLGWSGEIFQDIWREITIFFWSFSFKFVQRNLLRRQFRSR
jgi:hypothetical protein